MVSTAARNTTSEATEKTVKLTMPQNTTLYHGTMVMRDSNGMAVPAGAAAGNKGVAGLVDGTHTTGANETKDVIAVEGVHLLNADNITKANEGDVCYAVDNDTVSTSAGTNRARAGRIVRFETQTSCYVRLGADVQ